MATNKNSTSNAAVAPSKGAFILTDTELSALSSARGRKATDSEYLAEVKIALDTPTVFGKDGNIESGDVHGIRLTETLVASWVGPQLRKAASQLGIDTKRFTVLDRSTSKSDANPNGFMAYWVKPEETTVPVAEEATVTESA